MEVPEHLSLLYPIQLKGRLDLDKNILNVVNNKEENNTSVFESTPPILNAEEIRKLAKLVIKIEFLASGRIQKEPDESSNLITNDKEDGRRISINEHDEQSNENENINTNENINDKKSTEYDGLFTVVSANLLTPAIPDGASDEELIAILEALVSRMNNAINTINMNRIKSILESDQDKDKIMNDILNITEMMKQIPN